MLVGMIRYIDIARGEIKPWIWSLLAMLYIGAVLPGRASMILALCFVSFQALKEYFSIVPMRQAERPLLLLGYLSIPLQYICVALNHHAPALAVTPLYIIGLSLYWLHKQGRTPQTLHSIFKIGWGIFTLVYTLSYIGLLIRWPPEMELAGSGTGLLFFFLLTVHFQGIMQFLFGRWGINSWSLPLVNNSAIGAAGLLSVLAGAIIASSIGPRLTWLAPQPALWAGLLIGGTAYIGSVTIQAVQHALYIREEDALLPGMGGILTFIYPLAYAAPFLLFFLMLLEH